MEIKHVLAGVAILLVLYILLNSKNTKRRPTLRNLIKEKFGNIPTIIPRDGLKMECGVNQEMIDNTCYNKCPVGYIPNKKNCELDPNIISYKKDLDKINSIPIQNMPDYIYKTLDNIAFKTKEMMYNKNTTEELKMYLNNIYNQALISMKILLLSKSIKDLKARMMKTRSKDELSQINIMLNRTTDDIKKVIDDKNLDSILRQNFIDFINIYKNDGVAIGKGIATRN